MRSATVKASPDKIRAALPLVLDAVKCGGDDGPIPLQIAIANSMAESVEQRKNPKQRPQCGVGLATHTCRQHAQRNVWIVPEQRRHNSRAQRRPKRFVEIVLQRERALPHDGVTRIKRWLGVMLLKLSDDARGIRDSPAIEPQNGQLALPRRAPDPIR